MTSACILTDKDFNVILEEESQKDTLCVVDHPIMRMAEKYGEILKRN
jgi:hypothetical protein